MLVAWVRPPRNDNSNVVLAYRDNDVSSATVPLVALVLSGNLTYLAAL